MGILSLVFGSMACALLFYMAKMNGECECYASNHLILTFLPTLFAASKLSTEGTLSVDISVSALKNHFRVDIIYMSGLWIKVMAMNADFLGGMVVDDLVVLSCAAAAKTNPTWNGKLL